MWLTLGVHNLIIICRDEHLDETIFDLCSDNGISYERWQIQKEGTDTDAEFAGNTIEYDNPAEYTVSGQRTHSALSEGAFRNASIQADDSLGFMQLELYALLSVIASRTTASYSVIASDCLSVEKLASYLILDAPDSSTPNTLSPALQKYEILLTLNAGLSRLSSQALSGTSPILRTECHFWPHSLLGIGVASLALRNLTSFISEIIQTTKYHQRIDLLTQTNVDLSQFPIRSDKERFPAYLSIDRGAIFHAAHADRISDSRLELVDSKEYYTPNPITYYSGRDGFMNGILTTSAPLPSVSGANSYQWNLGTITHELSHRIVSGDLANLFDCFLSDLAAAQENELSVWDYFNQTPKTFGCLAQRFLSYAAMTLHVADYEYGEAKQLFERRPYDFFWSAINRYGEEIEEMMVHIFDYYHFYGSDPKTYCDFIWLSWAVQPSIEKKLDDYIRRTLTALGVRHLNRENWIELTFADFEAVLNSEPLRSKLAFRHEVLDRFSNGEMKDNTITYLRAMEYLLSIFHLLFKVEGLQVAASAELYREPIFRYRKTRSGTVEKKRFNYRNSALSFVSENPSVSRPRFSNPLLFLRDYSREETPNAAQAAWLLHMLAFNWSR